MSVLDELRKEVAGCTRCAELVGSRTQTVFGDGTADAEVMFVGEAPGREEDEQGVPFVGPAGRLMDSAMEQSGIPRSKVYIANTLKCRPPENRDPLQEEIDNCSAYLAAQVALIRPKVIVPLGRFGLEQMVKKGMKISEVHGKPIRRKDGIIFFPMYHPAAALHQPKFRQEILTDFKKLAKLLKREGLL
jgi:uracil-DNA glycosylase family 4